jgi:hypothetical protein
VFLFGIHVLGNAPAPTAVGELAKHSDLPRALMSAVVAFALSGVFFCIVARRQRLAAETEAGSSAA